MQLSDTERRDIGKKALGLSLLALVAFLLGAMIIRPDAGRVLMQGAIAAILLVLFLSAVFAYLRCEKRSGDCRISAKLLRISFAAGATVLLAFAFATMYCYLVTYSWFATGNETLGVLIAGAFAGSNLLRAVILLPFCAYLAFSVIYPVRRVLDFMVMRRWQIAGCVFLLLLLCSVNISNVSAFDSIVQPSHGGDLAWALLGVPRGIRSDEWLVNLPSLVSTEYAGYGEINDILRGTENYNLPATSLQLGYSMLSNPLNLGYYLFGARLGAAFFWSGTLILSVMLAFEFGYIISGKKPFFGLLGIALIGLSPFSMWWSVCALMNGWLAIFVSAYYALHADRFRDRVLLMVAVAFSGAYFVCRFYPAWQVPMVYLLLAALIWLVVDSFAAIRAFGKRDWLAATLCIVFMVSIILAHLFDIREYTKEVMSTVYPGARFETGGYALEKPFSFIQTLMLPFRDIMVGSNNSEAATFFSLFPLPILLSVYSLVRQFIARRRDRTQKIDLFTLLLLIPTLFLALYTTVGIPAWLAKITLMSYSTAPRTADWLAFANTVLLIRYIASERSYRLPASVTALLVGATVANSILHATAMCPGYMPLVYVLAASAVTVAFGTVAFSEVNPKEGRAVLGTLSVLLILLGFFVNPINSGIGALTEKPVAKEIQSIAAVEPDAKWIGYGNIIVGQYVVANGAPCVTSTNYVPNMALWTRLDPEGRYNEVYNRYAHVLLTFTEEETSFTLLGGDYIRLDLSYADVKLTEAKYLFSLEPVSENSDALDLRELYCLENAYIYEIVYLK